MSARETRLRDLFSEVSAGWGSTSRRMFEILERAAEIGAEVEREECAKLADLIGIDYGLEDALKVSRAIRARSEK